MKLLVLDRDGTLNPNDEGYVGTADAWSAQPGVLQAIARLNQAGWRIVIATNQPGLGRGLFDMATLNAIHAKMHRQLAAVGGRIDAVFYCPHAPDEACACRKPAPGLMQQIRERYGLEGHEMHVAGRSGLHLQAGAAVGASLHWVCTDEVWLSQPQAALPAPVPEGSRAYASLTDVADYLLQIATPVASSDSVAQGVPGH